MTWQLYEITDVSEIKTTWKKMEQGGRQRMEESDADTVTELNLTCSKLTAANAEIDRLLLEGRGACDAWNEELTAERGKVEKLRRKLLYILNHSQSGIDGPYIEEAIRQALADSEEA